jgi:hypothetical protein
MALVPTISKVHPGNWNSVLSFNKDTRKAFQILTTLRLGPDSIPTFGSLTLDNLTASRLVNTDADKTLTSVDDLTAWIAGTTNQVISTDDTDGTLTLSLPQDIHVDATPEFEGLTIRHSDDTIIMYVDNTEFYITKTAAVGAAGEPMGLLLTLTYSS